MEDAGGRGQSPRTVAQQHHQKQLPFLNSEEELPEFFLKKICRPGRADKNYVSTLTDSTMYCVDLAFLILFFLTLKLQHR